MTWVLGLAVAYITVVSWTACLFKAAAFADEKIAKGTDDTTHKLLHLAPNIQEQACSGLHAASAP